MHHIITQPVLLSFWNKEKTSLKIPQRPKRMQSLDPTPLHHFIIALHITRNEDHLGLPPHPRLSQQGHGIGSTAPLLRVPKDHALRLDVLVDETRNRGPERAFLVRPDPDEKPVGGLYAGGERSANASTGADADSALEHGGCVADASYSTPMQLV